MRTKDRVTQVTNNPPAPVPEPVSGLAALVREYQDAEIQQAERLATIWSTMAAKPSGTRFVMFSNGVRWSVNQFLVPDPSRRDLPMISAVSGLVANIVDWSE